MYKLMIVDDEEWIREGIAKTIPWEKYGIIVCSTASNAQEAMEEFRIHHPDVVVTDIVMPGNTGVELCGWIQKEREHAKVIMLSGYDEFAYAKEAMGKGAFDYLLKPVEEQVLAETVVRAAKALSSERDREEKAERYHTSLESLKQLFFLKLLDSKDTRMVLQGDEDQYLDISIGEEWEYACAIWKFGEHEEIKLQMVRELIEHSGKGRLREIRSDTILIGDQLLFLGSGKGDMQEALYNFFVTMDAVTILIPDSGCCISHTCTGIEHLKEIICQATHVLKNQFQVKGILRVQDMEKSQKEHLNACRNCMRSFVEHLDVTDQEQTKDSTSRLISEILRTAPGVGKTELGSLLFQVMSEVARRYQREDVPMEMPVTEKNEAVSWIFSLEHTQQAVAGLLQFFDYVYDNITFRKQEKKNYLIEESLKYIQENFHRDLSAEELSEFLRISKVYFSQLFHREMGCTFTKYLTEYRMNHAKKLLLQTNSRIYEVAEACGYGDVKYFLKVFKKITGQSPQAYREHHRE